MTEQVLRSRRSCQAVPGSNPRFLEKAKGLDADQVFLDLEDSVAPIAKVGARSTVVEGAGADLDCVMLPKVQTAEHVVALDLLLTQVERTVGLEVGRIGIEAQ